MTSVEWLEIELNELQSTEDKRSLSLQLDLIDEAFKNAKETESKKAMQYALFCIECFKNDLPLLIFEDWIKKIKND